MLSKFNSKDSLIERVDHKVRNNMRLPLQAWQNVEEESNS